jgi:alpha-1,2-mannosyltransferase
VSIAVAYIIDHLCHSISHSLQSFYSSEMMAAGLLVIAHDSGGPQTDIVKHQRTGFLATSADDYAQAILQALEMSEQEANDMRSRAQQSALRFSDDVFDYSFNKTVAKLLQ